MFGSAVTGPERGNCENDAGRRATGMLDADIRQGLIRAVEDNDNARMAIDRHTWTCVKY